MCSIELNTLTKQHNTTKQKKNKKQHLTSETVPLLIWVFEKTVKSFHMDYVLSKL